MSEMKKIGGHRLRFRDKAYLWKTNLAHLIQYGLQGLKLKNIEGESMEANDLSNILWKLGSVG